MSETPAEYRSSDDAPDVDRRDKYGLDAYDQHALDCIQEADTDDADFGDLLELARRVIRAMRARIDELTA